MISKQASDRNKEGESENSNDEAANDVPATCPIRPELAASVDMPCRERHGIDGIQDSRHKEGNKGYVIATSDAL